jgi:hypothetical protein
MNAVRRYLERRRVLRLLTAVDRSLARPAPSGLTARRPL